MPQPESNSAASTRPSSLQSSSLNTASYRAFDGFDSQERRGLFDGLRVPHSLNATLIAGLGLLIYYLGVRALEEGFHIEGTGHCRLIAGMLGNLSSQSGGFGAFLALCGGWANTPTSYHGGVWLLFFGWTAIVWAFFAGAICRIAAVKLAREEVIELKEALRFAAHKFLPNLLSLVAVLMFVGLFLLLINGTVGGLIGRIPYLGDVLVGIFFPLALVASFLAVFVMTLGLLGFNLAAAAIATEASDTFDGVSRAWNYVLARPWQVLLTLFATTLYLSLVIFFGQMFLRLSVDSLAIKGWGMGNAPRVIPLAEDERDGLPAGIDYVLVPGKGDYLYERVFGKRYTPQEKTDGKDAIVFNQGLDFALERYRSHVGTYPDSLSALVKAPEAVKDRWHGPYLRVRELPTDGFGHAYEYRADPKLREGYELRSAGRDGRLGTDDDELLIDLERRLGPQGPPLDIAPYLEPTLGFEVRAVKSWLGLARILLYGYVVAYFLSAQTLVYFLLRRDVEGDDYTEVTLDDEHDDYEDDLHYVGGKVSVGSTATSSETASKDAPSAGEVKAADETADKAADQTEPSDSGEGDSSEGKDGEGGDAEGKDAGTGDSGPSA